MADFETAVQKTIANEGGDKYTETKDDNGGATKYGISEGFINTMMRGNFTKEQCIDKVKNLTLLDARRLYKQYFWDANRYGEINDQAIAEKIFDIAVLMGASQTNKLVQYVINDFRSSYIKIDEDGIFGEVTIDQLNDLTTAAYIEETLNLNFIKYLVEICNKDKTQEKFLLGWLNRVMS